MRLHTLDYLRGIAALSILVFHFISFNYGDLGALLRKVGVYGVSIFYVLSGLTLYTVSSRGEFKIKAFARKRFLRIYPLLILVTLLTVVLRPGREPLSDILLNITGLFGFVAYDRYVATGAWSIGNELVFYAMFPVLFYACKKVKLTILIGAVLLAFMVYFSFTSPSWKDYINPLNQAYLFFAGMLIGRYMRDVSGRMALLLIVIPLALFIIIPVGYDADVYTGWTRVVFSALVIAICAGVYRLPSSKYLHKPLSWLGEISYGVYLFHPLVLSVIKPKLTFLPLWATLVIAGIVTFIVAHLSYQYMEKIFVKMGRKEPMKVKKTFITTLNKERS